MLAVNLAHGLQVLQGDRLPAAGIVGDRDHAQRDRSRPDTVDERLELADVHVAFEGMTVAGIRRFIDDKVLRTSAPRPDVAFGRVEVHVAGDVGLRGYELGTEDVLRCPSLMRGHEVCKTEDLIDSVLQAEV